MNAAQKLAAELLETLLTQARTIPQGKAIYAAGLGDQLEQVLRAGANNAAQWLVLDYVPAE